MARLIDTSIFVAIERRGESLGALVAILGDEPFALASISASELLVGVRRSATARQQRRSAFVEAVIGQVPILPFGLDATRTHAQLSVELAVVGQMIGPNDLLIAATALTHGYSALTENLRHFERVPGLAVDRPRW